MNEPTQCQQDEMVGLMTNASSFALFDDSCCEHTILGCTYSQHLFKIKNSAVLH